jgi:hypothetical protein
VRGIARRDLGRIEVRAQQALARARLLDLGNHRRLAAGDFRPQRANKIARRRRSARLVTHAFERPHALRRGDFFRFDN